MTSGRSWCSGLGSVATAALIVSACAVSAAAASTPNAGTAGPALLREPAGVAPPLTNTGFWRAPSTLVSGSTAYRDGEFLYPDYLYEDAGANGQTRAPTDPMTGADDFAARVGPYTYPTDPRYHHNAADLVEFRVKPLSEATAFRVTLNTLDDPRRVAFTIALGDSPAPVAYPHGAQVSGPAQRFLTVHGTAADLLDAATGKPAGPPPSVKVDRLRHQLQVTVPHSSWNP